MSKLADHVRKATSVEPRRLGFGAASAAAAPTMVVVALAESGAGTADGADLLLLPGDKMPKNKPALPFGLLLPELTASAADAAVAAGADFVVFDPDRSEAAALLTDGLGFVATVSQDMADVELRVLEALPLDALYLPVLPRPLTVRAQLAVQRITALAHTPLLVPAAGLSAGELEGLRDAGVALVLADNPAAAKDLRTLVGGLRPRRRRRGGREPEVILPRPRTEGEEEEEEEFQEA